MIDKNELKDWLAESDRRRAVKEIEEYVDSAIKRNVLKCEYTFYIATGRYERSGSAKTAFYKLWYPDYLSRENRLIVQERIIEKYKNFGFEIRETSTDCGWNNSYSALKFTDVNKLIEAEN